MSITYNPLWKTLIDKNMNKEDLRKLTNISPSTMAKMSKDEYVALRVIEDICKVLNVKSISEVVEYIPIGVDMLPESELDMLENTINVIQHKMMNHEEISDSEFDFLYDLVLKTLKTWDTFNVYDSERFSKAYVSCIKLLPIDLSNKLASAYIRSLY